MVVLRKDILEEVQSTNIELLTFIEKKRMYLVLLKESSTIQIELLTLH